MTGTIRASRASPGTTRPPATRWSPRWSTTPTGSSTGCADADWTSRRAQAVALLALVAGQDVEPAEGSDGTDGRWRIARRVAEDRVISHGRPAGPARAQDRPPPPGRLQGPRGGRAGHRAVHRRRDDRGRAARTTTKPWSGWRCWTTTPPMTRHHDRPRSRCSATLPTAPATPAPRSAASRPHRDHQTRAAAPGRRRRVHPRRLHRRRDRRHRHLPERRHPAASPPPATSSSASPAARCPLRQRCTTAKDGRSLSLHQHDALLRAARHDWATDEDLRATYRRHRPMVERSIAWLIGPKGRCRQLRYRGVTANDWWLHTRMAALNLRRLLNLGLHHDHRTWSITPAAA